MSDIANEAGVARQIAYNAFPAERRYIKARRTRHRLHSPGHR
ncbi:MAG: hypothetical protein JJ894_17170 [Dinoroseobacter sp.]|nr:hypothetical protein [Dinoroseobacter sp.]